MVTWNQRGQIDDQLVLAAVNFLVTALTQRPDMSEAALRDVMVYASSNYGAQTAATAYQALRTSRETWHQWDILPEPELAAAVNPDQVSAATAWALQTKNPRVSLTPAQAQERLAGVLTRMVRQPGRLTVVNATAAAGTRYARVPGPKACDFCLMLASRGGVYLSRAKALLASGERGVRPEGTRFHDFCGCQVVESYTNADLPKVVHDLHAEWNEYMKDADGMPLDFQLGRWREHVAATRPDHTTLPTAPPPGAH